MSRAAKAEAERWSGWAADSEARYPLTGDEVLVTMLDGRTLAAETRHRYRGGSWLVTLETGETRPVPGHWIETV